MNKYLMQYSLLEIADEPRTKANAPYVTVISARVSGRIQRFELANLPRHPDQGVPEPRRHV
jgi:hypothetical protein